jgi:hypothetical protein
MFPLANVLLICTALGAAYMIWRFWVRYRQQRGLHDVYYILGFLTLLISGLLLLLRGDGILASPYVLTVASLIPLGISMGIAEQYFRTWKRAFKWFALVGLIVIAVGSIGDIPLLRKISVPVFHGGAGLVIILGPFFASSASAGFRWVGIGGMFIGLAGLSLSFLSAGSQLLMFSRQVVLQMLPALLLLMTLAFTWGFMRDIGKGAPAHAAGS